MCSGDRDQCLHSILSWSGLVLSMPVIWVAQIFKWHSLTIMLSVPYKPHQTLHISYNYSGQNYLFTFPEATKYKLFYYSSRITSTRYGIESYLWAETVVIGLVRNCGCPDTSYCVEWATLVYHSWFWGRPDVILQVDCRWQHQQETNAANTKWFLLRNVRVFFTSPHKYLLRNSSCLFRGRFIRLRFNV